MFVLLEHETAPGTAPATSGADRAAVHWDLMIEIPSQERLATWRLVLDPLGGAETIPAERLADHRRVYLDYEGEISGGRGRVRRLDRGAATVKRCAGGELQTQLQGMHLRGRCEIVPAASGQLVVRRAAGA